MLILYYVLGIMLSILHKTSLSIRLKTLRVNFICYNSHLADEKILRLREV